jgi:hypothetical protein
MAVPLSGCDVVATRSLSGAIWTPSERSDA